MELHFLLSIFSGLTRIHFIVDLGFDDEVYDVEGVTMFTRL